MQFPSLKIKAEIEVGSTVANGCGKDFRPVVSCRCLNAICGPKKNLRKIGFPIYSLLVHFLFFKKSAWQQKNLPATSILHGFFRRIYGMYARWWFHIFFLCSPLSGETIPVLTHIFQRG